MQAVQAVVLLEFFQLPDWDQYKHVICVTQRAYERVLSALYGNEFPEQIVTELVHPDVCVRFFGSEPFDCTQVKLDGQHTLRDYLPPIPLDIVVQDLQRLANFEHLDTYVYSKPDGGYYSLYKTITPGDTNVLSFLEFARCLYARLFCFTHSPKVQPSKPRTMYIRGGGQHGTICWGGACAVLRHSVEPFTYFAGDSFGAAVAVMCALDPSGQHLFFDRMMQVCHRMKLDESDQPLNREAALGFVRHSLHEYIDRTLSELDLPVDILVSNLERGVEHAVLNRHTAPDMKLGDALVASMSIPVIIGEHFQCLDGTLTAWDYVERLGPESIVVGLATTKMPMGLLRAFGLCGSALVGLVDMWQDLTGQKSGAIESYRPFRQFCIPAREPDVSTIGGSIGTTPWHILNFQFGFDQVSSVF